MSFVHQGDAPLQTRRYLFAEVMFHCKPSVICSTETCSVANPQFFAHPGDVPLQIPHYLLAKLMLCCKSRYSFNGGMLKKSVFLQNSELLGCCSWNLLTKQRVCSGLGHPPCAGRGFTPNLWGQNKDGTVRMDGKKILKLLLDFFYFFF